MCGGRDRQVLWRLSCWVGVLSINKKERGRRERGVLHACNQEGRPRKQRSGRNFPIRKVCDGHGEENETFFGGGG